MAILLVLSPLPSLPDPFPRPAPDFPLPPVSGPFPFAVSAPFPLPPCRGPYPCRRGRGISIALGPFPSPAPFPPCLPVVLACRSFCRHRGCPSPHPSCFLRRCRKHPRAGCLLGPQASPPYLQPRRLRFRCRATSLMRRLEFAGCVVAPLAKPKLGSEAPEDGKRPEGVVRGLNRSRRISPVVGSMTTSRR